MPGRPFFYLYRPPTPTRNPPSAAVASLRLGGALRRASPCGLALPQCLAAALLKPLRRAPKLTEPLLWRLKRTLGAMFEDPFAVRDVAVAVRGVMDNVLIHADSDRAPARRFSSAVD